MLLNYQNYQKLLFNLSHTERYKLGRHELMTNWLHIAKLSPTHDMLATTSSEIITISGKM